MAYNRSGYQWRNEKDYGRDRMPRLGDDINNRGYNQGRSGYTKPIPYPLSNLIARMRAETQASRPDVTKDWTERDKIHPNTFEGHSGRVIDTARSQQTERRQGFTSSSYRSQTRRRQNNTPFHYRDKTRRSRSLDWKPRPSDEQPAGKRAKTSDRHRRHDSSSHPETIRGNRLKESKSNSSVASHTHSGGGDSKGCVGRTRSSPRMNRRSADAVYSTSHSEPRSKSPAGYCDENVNVDSAQTGTQQTVYFIPEKRWWKAERQQPNGDATGKTTDYDYKTDYKTTLENGSSGTSSSDRSNNSSSASSASNSNNAETVEDDKSDKSSTGGSEVDVRPRTTAKIGRSNRHSVAACGEANSDEKAFEQNDKAVASMAAKTGNTIVLEDNAKAFNFSRRKTKGSRPLQAQPPQAEPLKEDGADLVAKKCKRQKRTAGEEEKSTPGDRFAYGNSHDLGGFEQDEIAVASMAAKTVLEVNAKAIDVSARKKKKKGLGPPQARAPQAELLKENDANLIAKKCKRQKRTLGEEVKSTPGDRDATGNSHDLGGFKQDGTAVASMATKTGNTAVLEDNDEAIGVSARKKKKKGSRPLQAELPTLPQGSAAVAPTLTYLGSSDCATPGSVMLPSSPPTHMSCNAFEAWGPPAESGNAIDSCQSVCTQPRQCDAQTCNPYRSNNSSPVLSVMSSTLTGYTQEQRDLDFTSVEVVPAALLALIKTLIQCSSCNITFNRTVICKKYLIGLNRPIQCVCSCVICIVCYRKHAGCAKHQIKSSAATVSASIGKLASSPDVDNKSDWDLELNPEDAFKSDIQVNGHVQQMLSRGDAPGLSELKDAFHLLINTNDSFSFRYWETETLPMSVASRYVCIPHVPRFWNHILVGTRTAPKTADMLAADDHLPKLFNVSLGTRSFHWCCFVLKKQIILAMWFTVASEGLTRIVTFVDEDVKDLTSSIEFKRMVIYLARWFRVQYEKPDGRQLRVVLDCKPSEGASLAQMMALLAFKSGMEEEHPTPTQHRESIDIRYTFSQTRANTIFTCPVETVSESYVNIVEVFNEHNVKGVGIPFFSTSVNVYYAE